MSASTAKPTTASTTSTTGCGGSSCLPVCTLEIALKNITDIYHRYAIREKKDDSLTFKDMKQLLECQAPTFLSACGRSNPKYLEKLFKSADVNNDKDLSFEEFIKIICIMADDAHRITHGEDRCGPDKD